jgi:hypothetical protein
MEFLSEFGPQRTIIDRTPNLKQQFGAAPSVIAVPTLSPARGRSA